MSIQSEIDHSRNFVRTVVRGPVGVQAICEHFTQLMMDGALSYAKLVDIQGGQLVLEDADFMEMAARTLAYVQSSGMGPVAFVTRSDRNVHALRRYLNLAGKDRPGRIFSTVKRAEKWLSDKMASGGFGEQKPLRGGV